MKKVLVFAMAMALGVSATAFAANPFSDVPAGHWAYAAVAQLAAEGVVNGYPDGTFKGDQLMTRYEMAQIVAKALAKGAVNNNDALVAEFADELDNLGVRVAKLEKKSDNVKITGSMRYRYFSHDTSGTIDDYMGDGKYTKPDTSELRTRLGIAGSINDNWTYMAMIENDKNFGHDIGYDAENNRSSDDDNTEFRRAWLKGNIGEVGVTLGRWDYTVLDGNVFDDEMDGIKLDFAAGEVDLSLAYGRWDYSLFDANFDLFIATAMTEIGAIDAKIAYYNVNVEYEDEYEDEDEDENEKANFYTIGLSGDIAKDLNIGGTYIKSDIDDSGDDDGYALSLNYKGADKMVVGSYGLYAMYYDQPRATYIVHTTDANTFDDLDDSSGFKGYTLGVDYTVAKNVVATVNYFDTEAQDDDEEDKIIMSQLYVFF